MSALGGMRYRNGGDEDPRLLDPDGTDPDYADLFDRLRGLGYEPLGLGFMRLTYAGVRWTVRAEVRAFRSRARGRFAFLQRLAPPNDDWSAAFATAWDDGGLLLTTNQTAFPLRDADTDYQQQGVLTADLAALDAAHQQAADKLRAAGRRPDPDLSLDTLLAATERNAGPDMRRTFAAEGRVYLLTTLVMHGCVTLPVAATFGLTHWGVPLVNVLLAGLFRVGELAQQGQVAVALRAARQGAHRENT
jgi:hypothetical protein